MSIDDNLISAFADADAAFEAAEEELREQLDPILKKIVHPSDSFDYMEVRGNGDLRLVYSEYDGGSCDYTLTAADLAAEDPAKSYLDRKKAEETERNRRADELAREHDLKALAVKFNALTPAQREALIASAQAKS